MVYTIESLINKINESGRGYDVNKIRAAYKIANEAHEGQLRSSGEPYISHPLAVAGILLDYFMDTDSICAALLHDVVEDTDIPLDVIRKNFGADVAMLVDGVTKISKVPLNTEKEHQDSGSKKIIIITKEERQAENIRKILIAMSKDIRVIIIKLADRLHNMRTLECRRPEKQRSTSLETMNFYASIAHRLGMSNVKEEMEKLALRYLDPYGYKTIEEHLSIQKKERETFINFIIERIRERVDYLVPKLIIEGRVKGIYSIYKKLYLAGKGFGEIYDIYAVRIIVNTIAECYTVLGVIHDMFRPIPGRFKDYIATPKPNHYQSLHTTVIEREGIPFEVQIRTVDMHNTAQYGIAAHWKYKAGIEGRTANENRLDWIRQILEQQLEADDVEQITDAVRIDLTPDEVYVFTPKGEVKSLPVGSTVIDFAYAIHTQVGNKMTGAKVGGRMASFDHELKTGDIVEIMTTGNKSYGPNLNWLEIARTTEAKAKIRAWHKRENREANIIEGQKKLDAEFKRNRIPWDNDFIKALAVRQRFINVNDFYAAIGYGGVSLVKIMQRVKSDYEKSHKPADANIAEITVAQNINIKQSGGVSVEGMNNFEVKYAKCCNPLPGDEIVGFITKGHGISIHKNDCPNVRSNMNRDISSERWVKAAWNSALSAYRVTVDIVADDRKALIADISALLSENKLSIIDMNAHFLKNGNANILTTFEVAGVEQLKNIITKIKKIPGVISAERTGKL